MNVHEEARRYKKEAVHPLLLVIGWPRQTGPNF